MRELTGSAATEVVDFGITKDGVYHFMPVCDKDGQVLALYLLVRVSSLLVRVSSLLVRVSSLPKMFLPVIGFRACLSR